MTDALDEKNLATRYTNAGGKITLRNCGYWHATVVATQPSDTCPVGALTHTKEPSDYYTLAGWNKSTFGPLTLTRQERRN